MSDSHLILTRHQEQSVEITVPPSSEPTLVRVRVEDIRGDSKVRLGFFAPRNVTVHRAEVAEAIRREQRGRR